LSLDAENFILFGNSWGGILAMEYALKYQKNLKGLVVSGMQASIKGYMDYVHGTIEPQLDPKAVKRIKELEMAGDFENEEYMKLLTPFYEKFVFGMPIHTLPEPLQKFLGTVNGQVYHHLNGPSEFSCTGTLVDWSVKDRINEIKVPSLFIGSMDNTMDPKQMRWMASEVKKGEYFHCQGSHMAMWNNPEQYFGGLLAFLRKFDKK
jgi:proline iminopeptidase